MTSVLQPRSSSRDMIRCAFTLNLDQNRQVLHRLSIPLRKRFQQLQTIALGIDLDDNGAPVLGRRLEGILSGVVSPDGERVSRWGAEFELLASGCGKRVGEGVERERTGKGEGGDEIGRGDKGVGGRVGVVTSSEVTVVRSDDYQKKKKMSKDIFI